MRFGELTYDEIAQGASQGAVAVLPTGCTEQQGPHLTVDNDTWFAEALTLEAAEQVAPEVTAVVLPALPFGPTPEHRGFGAGFIDIPVVVFDAFVRSILDSLADQGFNRILVWRGCGGHDLRNVIRSFNTTRAGSARAFLPGHPFDRIWCSVGDASVPVGHADSFTTSIVMHRRPTALRKNRVPQDASLEPDWSDPSIDFSRYSSTGVIGSAAAASRQLGEQLWRASVDAVAELLRRVDADPDNMDIQPTE